MPDAYTLPIPEPGIVVLVDVDFADEDDLQHLHDQIVRVAGHDRFVILHLSSGGEVRVLGSPDEAVAYVREQLAERETEATDEPA